MAQIDLQFIVDPLAALLIHLSTTEQENMSHDLVGSDGRGRMCIMGEPVHRAQP